MKNAGPRAQGLTTCWYRRQAATGQKEPCPERGMSKVIPREADRVLVDLMKTASPELE